MLATLGGFLALVLGLTILLLPLLVTELSRPRDSAWGAVVLLLGLVLVTSSERLTGAPMLAVLCGGLLIGRLGSEVAQGRWRALSDEERTSLLSSQRWSRSLAQLGASGASLLQSAAGLLSGLTAWQAQRSQARPRGKRWVRAESGAEATEQAGPRSEPGAATRMDTRTADTAAASDDAAPAAVAAAEPSASPESVLDSSPQQAGPLIGMPAAPPPPGEEADRNDGDAPAAPAPPGFLPADARPASGPEAGDPPPPPPRVAGTQAPGTVASEPPPQDGDVRVVADFRGIEALLEAAGPSGSPTVEPEGLPPKPEA